MSFFLSICRVSCWCLFYYCACAEEIGLFLTLWDITGGLRLPENQPQYSDFCHLVFSRKWKRCGSHRISWTVNVLAGVFPAPWKASKAAWKMLLAAAAHASSPWWEQFSNTCTGLCSRSLCPPWYSQSSARCVLTLPILDTIGATWLFTNTRFNVKTQEQRLYQVNFIMSKTLDQVL